MSFPLQPVWVHYADHLLAPCLFHLRYGLISPRTIGHHLANVYPRLGITSRAELARIDFEGELRLS